MKEQKLDMGYLIFSRPESLGNFCISSRRDRFAESFLELAEESLRDRRIAVQFRALELLGSFLTDAGLWTSDGIAAIMQAP